MRNPRSVAGAVGARRDRRAASPRRRRARCSRGSPTPGLPSGLAGRGPPAWTRGHRPDTRVRGGRSRPYPHTSSGSRGGSPRPDPRGTAAPAPGRHRLRPRPSGRCDPRSDRQRKRVRRRCSRRRCVRPRRRRPRRHQRSGGHRSPGVGRSGRANPHHTPMTMRPGVNRFLVWATVGPRVRIPRDGRAMERWPSYEKRRSSISARVTPACPATSLRIAASVPTRSGPPRGIVTWCSPRRSCSSRSDQGVRESG